MEYVETRAAPNFDSFSHDASRKGVTKRRIGAYRKLQKRLNELREELEKDCPHFYKKSFDEMLAELQ